MADFLNREVYLNRIIDRMHDGEVKIITGTRRCGKSWLLKKVFFSYLISIGVKEDHIIRISLDNDDPDCNELLLDKENLKNFIYRGTFKTPFIDSELAFPAERHFSVTL